MPEKVMHFYWDGDRIAHCAGCRCEAMHQGFLLLLDENEDELLALCITCWEKLFDCLMWLAMTSYDFARGLGQMLVSATVPFPLYIVGDTPHGNRN